MASHEPAAQAFEEKVVYTGKKLRIGIVGAGGIASVHAQSYQDVPAADIVAVCDIVAENMNIFFIILAILKN